VLAALLAAALAGAVGSAGASGATVPARPVLRLPKPVGTIPVIKQAFEDRPDRLKYSQLPGPVDDTERVDVLVAPDGAPAEVTMTQRLDLSGTGQFIVIERSSAKDVEALDDTVAPVLKREAVVWQGFVSGRKTLAARLTLDPAVESVLLPLRVFLLWHGAGKIGPGGTLPGPGEVTVRLANATSRPSRLPTGDVAAKDLAGPLDALLAHAKRRTPAIPPAAGRGIPKTLPALSVGPPRDATTVAPFRVTGTIRAGGGTPVSDESPAVKHLADGLRVDGILQAGADFTVRVTAASTLALDLTAYPTLDPRLLTPPRGRTWADWLRLGPTAAETQAATTTLIENAAAAARDDEYAPYLGHHGPGTVRTTYRIRVAPPGKVRIAAKPLRPKGFPIALASVALLGVLGNAAALHRRL
jgi:hypothetical protein